MPNCCTSDAQCDDGNECTVDLCDLGVNACFHDEIPDCAVGCCLDSGECIPGVPPIECAGTPVAECPPPDSDGISRCIPPGKDCFPTPCGSTQVKFKDNPVPPNFFDVDDIIAKSLPYAGAIKLGNGDTIISRLEAAAPASGGPSAAVEIELVAMVLHSCEPIIVDYEDSVETVQWEVTVDLSGVGPSGQMEISRTHEDGGTYSANFYVQPVFTFCRVDDPLDCRFLDPAFDLGKGPVKLGTIGSPPWMYGEGGTVARDGVGCSSVNFVPGGKPHPTLNMCCVPIGHAGPGHLHVTGEVCTPCPEGACCNTASGSCMLVSDPLDCKGEYMGNGTDCQDSDSDGVADWFESNDCKNKKRNHCFTGTDPNNPDTDGDGLLDGYELKKTKCDPCVKDAVDTDMDGIGDTCAAEHFVKFSQPPKAKAEPQMCSNNPEKRCAANPDCWVCIGGDVDGQRCTSDAECAPAGICDTSGQCLPGDCPCDGDVNKDGLVTVEDVAAVITCLQNDSCDACVNSCDVNCDKKVNEADAKAVACLFQNPPDPAACCTLNACSNDPMVNCDTDADCPGECLEVPALPCDPNDPADFCLSLGFTCVTDGVCVHVNSLSPPGEDYPSDLDWNDGKPDQKVADDFQSDGRPITAVRWWGSNMRKGHGDDIEVDVFPDSEMTFEINADTDPPWSETITVVGPTTVVVDLGGIGDKQPNGLEEVSTEIVAMELTGNSVNLGPIIVRLRPWTSNPFMRTVGQIEEKANNTTGVLDIPPFTGTGSASTYFDVYFEIEVAGGDIYHNLIPKHIETQITHKPPAPGEKYESPDAIALYDENGNITSITIKAGFHIPDPDPKACDVKGSLCGDGATQECICETRAYEDPDITQCAEAGDLVLPCPHGECEVDLDCEVEGTKCFGQPGIFGCCAHNCGEEPPADPKLCDPEGGSCGSNPDCICLPLIDGTTLNCADPTLLVAPCANECTSDIDCIAPSKCFRDPNSAALGCCGYNCDEAPVDPKSCDQPGDSPLCGAAWTICSPIPGEECHCAVSTPNGGPDTTGPGVCADTNTVAFPIPIPCPGVGDQDCAAQGFPERKCVFDTCFGWICVENCPSVLLEDGRGTVAAPTAIPAPRPPTPSIDKDMLEFEPEDFDNSEVEHDGTGTVAAPPLNTSFQGILDKNTSIPPDTMGAVGPNHIMEMTNAAVRVFDRGGGPVTAQVTLRQFWAGAVAQHPPVRGKVNPFTTASNAGDRVFDPRVLYDQEADQWIATAINIRNGNQADSWLLVGISQTNNPNGMWNLYALKGDWTQAAGAGVVWADFPDLGIDSGNVYISANMYTPAGAFVDSRFWVFDKASMKGAGALNFGTAVSPVAGFGGSWRMAHAFDPAPLGHNYAISRWNNAHLRILEFNGVGAAAVPPVDRGFIEVAAWNEAGADAPQPNACPEIETNDTRLLNAVLRKGRIWTTHHVWDDSPKTEVRWYEVDPWAAVAWPGAPPEQQGRVCDDTSLWCYFPSIAVNKDGCMALGFSGSNATTFGSAYYTARFPTDPLNWEQPVSLLKAGEAPYVRIGAASGKNRWGDYSNTVVDPRDGHTFWTVQEYAEDFKGEPDCTVSPVANGGAWGTWWGSFQCDNKIDGWFVRFYETVKDEEASKKPLAEYFCDPKVVDMDLTKLPDCQDHNVYEYFVNLEDCCLVYSNIDSRNGFKPALKNAFHEEKGLWYDMSIQAVIGVKFWQDKETRECFVKKTGKGAFDHFWGWHTTINENGFWSAAEISKADGTTGGWRSVTPKCSDPNMAFELLTDIPEPICKDKCCQCGVGDHWVDFCGPGLDRMKSGALVGIDFDGDCVVDTNLVLGGPMDVEKSGPLDDSVRFPNTRPTDLHFDVIDTEITAMHLMGRGGVHLKAGVKHGLHPTYGVIAEQPEPDADWADSFFDVLFEVTSPDLPGPVYNWKPLRVETKISCVPPKGNYLHPVICPPIPLYPVKKPDPTVEPVAYLVSANHEPFAEWPCCLEDGTCQVMPPDECLNAGGDPLGPDEVCDPNPCTICKPSSPPERVKPKSPTNRYLLIKAGDPKQTQAIRVTFVDLPPPYDSWNGTKMWVGQPREVCENSGKGPETDPADCPASLPTRTFWAAPLVCEKAEAHYMDWRGQCVAGTCVGGLKDGQGCLVDEECHVKVALHHEGIIPNGVYDIQVIDEQCRNDDETAYSAPLTMTQSRWGDVCGPGPFGVCQAQADGTVDVTNDVLGILAKFSNVINLQKARADIEPRDVDMKVNVANDVLYALDAFTGGSYPFTPSGGPPCGP